VEAPAGAVICRRDEPGDRFYILQSGLLEVRLGLEASGLVVRHLRPGDVLGEMALLTGAPRSADVVAVEDSVLWALARHDFETLLARSPSLARAFNRALAQRVAQLTRMLEEREMGAARGITGLRFGPYQVVEQLGAGGMAVVYSTVHVTTKTSAALKVLPAAWGAAPELRERLAREAAALRRLQHPHVIQLFEVGEVEERLGGGCYLAMEWLPHGLDRLLRAQYPDPLAPFVALSLARDVADALAAVHRAGLIHRDVKPSNILLRADGAPVLTDFGLVAAQVASPESRRLTPSNVFVGTADYLAPEQITGGPADGRADVYALGVVLYEMLAGYVPFAGRDPLETLRAHVEEEPPALPPFVPDPARAIVEQALCKNPDESYSAAALRQALTGALGTVNEGAGE
jgi:serine/threonine protein kinase